MSAKNEPSFDVFVVFYSPIAGFCSQNGGSKPEVIRQKCDILR
jgi:hypothetical protein